MSRHRSILGRVGFLYAWLIVCGVGWSAALIVKGVQG